MSPIHIIGAGGLGRELAAALNLPGLKELFNLCAFIDDQYPVGDTVNGIPVAGGMHWLTQQNGLQLFIAIANNTVRENLVNQLTQHTFPRIIHPAVRPPDDFFVRIGNGSYISEGCVLTTNILIGRHTLLLPGCTLSHDTSIGDFCTLMPGVRITGGATIGNHAHIGAGTLITRHITIPPNTTIPPGSILQ